MEKFSKLANFVFSRKITPTHEIVFVPSIYLIHKYSFLYTRIYMYISRRKYDRVNKQLRTISHHNENTGKCGRANKYNNIIVYAWSHRLCR